MENIKREVGYYWAFRSNNWTITYWDGNTFWLGDDDFDETCFVIIEDRRIVRETGYKTETRFITLKGDRIKTASNFLYIPGSDKILIDNRDFRIFSINDEIDCSEREEKIIRRVVLTNL